VRSDRGTPSGRRIASSIQPRRRVPSSVESAPGVHVREGEVEGIAYLEVVLGHVDPESALPLLVVIHGRGDRPRIPGGPFDGLSHPVRVVMPRGPILVGEGFGWLPVLVAEGRTELLASALHDVAARLARVITRIRAIRACRGPTIVSGFSQGGMLAVTLAVHHPDVVGVAFPLAGWLPPPLWPVGPAPPGAPPIRALHAIDDERIAFAPTRDAYDRLRELGWDIEVAAFDDVGHAMSAEMDERVHAWLDAALDGVETGGALVAREPPRELEREAERSVEREPRRRVGRRRAPARSTSTARRRETARQRETARSTHPTATVPRTARSASASDSPTPPDPRARAHRPRSRPPRSSPPRPSPPRSSPPRSSHRR
jgi:phospholipase/carboxylesterase